MKLRIENRVTLLLIVITLLSCWAGCGKKDEADTNPQNQWKQKLASVDSRKPVKLPPFPALSLEGLIEQFKTDVAENKGDPEVIQRKKEAIANPDLLLSPLFRVPTISGDPNAIKGINPTRDDIMIRSTDQKDEPIPRYTFYDHTGVENGATFEFEGKIFYTTKEQEARLSELSTKIDSLPSDIYNRKRYGIKLENIDTLTAVKYLLQQGSPIPQTLGVEYAERAMHKNPNSFEAMFLWAHCTHPELKIDAYKQLLSKFPNAAIAHSRLGALYLNSGSPDLALVHVQKSIQLRGDSVFGNSLLANCYYRLGEYEKAIAVYQGAPWLHSGKNRAMRRAQDEI